MLDKRYFLARLMDSTFLFDILARYISKQRLIILNYHRICDRGNGLLIDEGVISATPEVFEEQLKFVKRCFSVIDLEMLYQHCIGGLQLPKNPVMITFDDGYRDNYCNAFRILQKYDLKATFFISTDYIEKRDMFWWDKIAYIIRDSNKGIVTLSYPYKEEFSISKAKDIAIKEIQDIVKTTYNLDLKLFIDELASSAEVELEDTSRVGDEMLLTWPEIKMMKKAGMDIGSHTKTHRILSNLPETELEYELSSSKSILEKHLGEPIYSISYPIGGDNTFNRKVQKLVEKCGYALAFSYGTGVNLSGTIAPFDIKRLDIDGVPFSYFKAIMAMPSMFVYTGRNRRKGKEQMKFEIISTPEGFLSLERNWRTILEENNESNFYLSFEWFYSLFFLSRSPPEHPYIISVSAQGEVIAIIPSCITKKVSRIFEFRSLEIMGNIYSPFRGCVVRHGRERDVAKALLDFLLNEQSRDWDMIDSGDLSKEDPFTAELIKSSERGKLQFRLTDQFKNVISDLTSFENSEDFFQSLGKNMRHQIRSKINRLNREGEFKIVLTTHKDQDVDAAMNQYYGIYGDSWKEGEEDPEFHLRIAKYLADKGYLRLFTLYFRPSDYEEDKGDTAAYSSACESIIKNSQVVPDGFVPIAVYFFIVFGEQAYALKTAYREDYSRYSPATVLFWFSIKHLIDVDKVGVIDHQKGDEDFKFRWEGKIKETRIRVSLANPRSSKASFEFWIERNIIPKLRKIKQKLSRIQPVH